MPAPRPQTHPSGHWTCGRIVLKVNFVASLDGATHIDGLSAGLSGEADKRLFRQLRRECDALLVGAGTFRAENYRPLTLDAPRRAWRVEHGLAEYPRLVVVSRNLALDPSHPALAAAPVRAAVLTTDDIAASAELSKVVDVIRGPSLAAGLAQLKSLGLNQILCEGGPQLFAALAKEDLIDELRLSLAPLLAGPGAGRITAGLPHEVRRMRLADWTVSDDGTLFLTYQRA
nr:dihydrofolate reductase family protein [Rhizocola hellebori]